MKIKTKLTLGVGLLFIMILLLSIVGAYNIYALKADSENILTANYNSLEFSRNMLAALESKAGDAMLEFELNLQKQEKNNTEIGEADATRELRKIFDANKSKRDGDSSFATIRENILEVMDLNMEAIQRKSSIAKITADKAVFWIAVSGTLCFIIAFTLLINMPSGIANPIRELTESIRQIAEKNYSERVHFEGHSEFGQLATSFNTMAQKLEEYNNSNLAKLMMEKQRIETLINNMHDPVIGLDEKQQILFINNEALKITGLQLDDVIGKPVQNIAVHNDLIRTLTQEFIQPVKKIIPKTEPLKIFADNKESFFEQEIIPISVIPTAEKNAKHIGDVIILQNITAFKELDFAKTNFIATVSHELKTPISSILMSLDLLKNERIGTVNEEQKQLIQSVKEDSERLLKITGELLNMTQAESGKIQLNLQPVAPKSIIDYATEVVKAQAESKNILIDVDCQENISAIHADSDKTTWVLTNLLVNAINYSYEKSKVIISVREETDSVKIIVQDFGKGIDPKYLPKLFDRYFQIPGSSKSGSGLGLAICKEFIEAQGGMICVQSEIGKGSSFTTVLNTVKE